MMKISASVLAAALTVGYTAVTAESAPPSIVEYTSMSVPEQHAFEAVALQCRSDVERHCDVNAMKNKAAVSMERSLGLPPFFQHPLMQMQQEHAPFVTFHRNTLEDFDSFLDHFMQAPPPPFLFMADQDAPDLILIVDMDIDMDDNVEEHPRQMLMSDTATAPRNSPCPFDTMIHQVISNMHPEQFTQVSQKMNDKGNEIILQGAVESAHAHATADNNNDSEQQQHTVTMARRLQEVTPEALHIHRSSFLPFDAATSDCLEQSYQAKIVSKGCGTALMGLHSIRAQERGAAIQEAQQETEMFRDLAVMYIFIMLTMILVTVRGRKILKQQIRLGDRIFAAVYSKPALKRAVEAELGQSVGVVPPIPFHRNLMRGALKKHFARAVRCFKCLRLLVISALAVLWVVAPEKVLPVACFIASFCFWTVLFNNRGKHLNMCCCCCCGVNTENVKKGNVTEAQACCSCCSGTGVCSLQCAQCCDDDDNNEAAAVNKSGGCSCCGGKGCCCCCNGKTSATAIEIGCCSCGKDCPSCCSSGTNNIEAGCCCCCCGGDGCSCCCQTSSVPKKSKVAQRTVLTVAHGDVYEGIPIQIV